jgi:hypothetical protein
MPYPLQLLDASTTSYSSATTCPLTVGFSFQPNDIRIIKVWTFNQSISASSFPGFTKTYDSGNVTSYGHFFYFTQILTAASVDSTLTLSTAAANIVSAVTVRNPKLSGISVVPTVGTAASGTSVASSNVTVAAQDLVLFYWDCICASSPALVGPATLTVLGQSDAAQEVSLFAAKTFTTAGSSGTFTTSTSPAASSTWRTEAIVLHQNPDVAVTIGTATTETDTATAATASLLNSVSFTIGTATEVDTASQMFTPLTGYRISPPLALPQSPITNSIISWTALTPAAGSTVKVETSVDGGLTWQTPVNNGAVPRLTFGTNFVQTVMTRVTLNRLVKTDASPSVPFLQVSVATDASHDELVPLGTFLITATDIEMVGGGATGGGSGGGGSGITGSGGGNNGGGGPIVTLTGVDLSREVSRRKWEDIYFIAIGTNYGMAIQEMIDNRLPGLQYNFASTPETVQSTLIYGDETGTDPWQDAQDLATDIGCQLFFDAAGVCTLRPVPDPATSGSVWEFSDTDNPVIASVTRSLTDESTYNYVIVQGEQSGDLPPVQAIAFDDDPNSITYYLGKYGIKPVTYTSAAITTEAQAQEAANAILLAVKGASETVTLDVSPMPALEPGDVITVTIAGVKASGDYLVQEVTTPISAAEAQSFVLYRQTA